MNQLTLELFAIFAIVREPSCASGLSIVNRSVSTPALMPVPAKIKESVENFLLRQLKGQGPQRYGASLDDFRREARSRGYVPDLMDD